MPVQAPAHLYKQHYNHEEHSGTEYQRASAGSAKRKQFNFDLNLDSDFNLDFDLSFDLHSDLDLNLDLVSHLAQMLSRGLHLLCA